MNRADAYGLLTEFVTDQSLVRHCLAVANVRIAVIAYACLLFLATLAASCSNLDERGNEAVGAAIGGAAGAVIGRELGGDQGAVVGAGAGAAAGAAIGAGQGNPGATPERVIVIEKSRRRGEDDDDDDDDRRRGRRHRD